MKLNSSVIEKKYAQLTDEELENMDREGLTEETQILYDKELRRRSSREYQTQNEAEKKAWEKKIRAEGYQAPFRKMRALRRWIILCLLLLFLIQISVYLFAVIGPGGDYLTGTVEAASIPYIFILIVLTVVIFKLSRLVYGEIQNFAEHGFQVTGGKRLAIFYAIFPILSYIVPISWMNTFIPQLVMMHSLLLLPALHLIIKASKVLKKENLSL